MISKTNSVPLKGLTADATAVATDILATKTAYAGGVKLTGTLTTADLTGDATATAGDILSGKTAYIANGANTPGTLFNYDAYAYQYDFRTYSGTTLNVTSINAHDYCVMLDTQNGALSPAGILQGNTTIVTATLDFPATANYARNLAKGCSNLEEITLGSTANCVNRTNYIPFNSMFYACSKLHTIHSALSFAGTTDSHVDNFFNCYALVNITFVANSIKSNLPIAQSPLLSTTSLLSIANGLDAASAPKTLTMHATAKTNMLALMVDDVAGVAVAGTTMTLTAFIADIKGWTVA